MLISELKNQKIAIIGFGKEGKSTLDFLLKVWVPSGNITILDQAWPLAPILQERGITGINTVTGKSYLDNLCDFDAIFKSPWVSPYHEKIAPVRKKLLSWAQLFFDNYDWKVIGVTGTKGKSTIATLIYKTLIEAWYDVKLVGNIGNPVLDEVDLIKWEKHDYIVYELSSYMLDTLKPKCFIGILSNLYPCHLTWHNNDFDIYKEAKLNLLKGSERILIEYDFNELMSWIAPDQSLYTFWWGGKYTYEDHKFYNLWEELFTDNRVLLKWEHNKKNICAVIWVWRLIKKYTDDSDEKFEVYIQSLQKVLSKFSGLPHRLENIWTYHDVTFIDDGISTTPESTIEAIKTFWYKIWTLFLGWADYWFTKASYWLLKDSIIEHHIRNIVLFPDTWNDVFWDISRNIKLWEQKVVTIEGIELLLLKTKSMKDAVDFAYINTEKWKTCLMSSAAPSYSLWKGYIEKGREYKSEIIKYTPKS